MLEFEIVADDLLLKYDSMPDNSWIYEKLAGGESVSIKRTFMVRSEHLYGQSASNNRNVSDPVSIKIGSREGDYFLLDRDILSISYDLRIHEDIPLHYRSFVAEKNVSIFAALDDLNPADVWVGGNHPGSMPNQSFERLVNRFPNTYELRKYVVARVSAEIRDFFETKKDGEATYHKYMNNKLSGSRSALNGMFRDSEILKYSVLIDKLTEMLNNEITYSETKWQMEILEILLLLYPKYIRVFMEVPVRDTYNNKDRNLDYMLVDSSGNVDIVEIKQPFDKCIVSNSLYRDNYIPLRELSGTVMQIEKYIFYLNKWGKAGEQFLTNKYGSGLPAGFEIRITNPSGIIVMGRDTNLTKEQRQDFEVIRRKYKNVIDIITYDDLLARLRFTIAQLKQGTS